MISKGDVVKIVEGKYAGKIALVLKTTEMGFGKVWLDVAVKTGSKPAWSEYHDHRKGVSLLPITVQSGIEDIFVETRIRESDAVKRS